MALRRLLQPNSTLRVCRLGFSAASARFCSSMRSGSDSNSPPQLKEEAGAEDTKIMPLEHIVKEAVEMEFGLPKATSLGNAIAGYGSPRKPKTLIDIFTVHKDLPPETMAENGESEQEDALLDYPNWSGRDESPSQFNGCKSGLELECISSKSADDRATIDRSTSLAFIHQSSEDCSNAVLIKDKPVHANVQKSDRHHRLNLLPFPAGTAAIVDKETSKSCFDAVNLKGRKENLRVSLRTSNKDQKQRQIKQSARTESEGHRVLVRFLRSYITERQIFEAFRKCGEILNIEFPDSQGFQFKACYIDFKTTKGLEKALDVSGSQILGPIIVESATSESRTAMTVPSLLGDPGIPAELVKNPTRTIRIEQLTEDMSSHHIVEALAFTNSNISGYFLGSSHSVAYVEFETDIGKEGALAKQSINVLGRHLVLLRIDCPRTTVVRISSPDSMEMKHVMSICKSLGDISTSTLRAPNVLDVHYEIAEWPNMLKILNRLNGCIVKGGALKAVPAPVFLPNVLLALWHQPEERKHLKATAQALLHNLGGTLDTSRLAFLENDLFTT